MEEECDRRGYRLTLCNSNDDLEKEKRNLSLLERMNADGVILMTNMDEIHKEVGNCRIPVVMIDRQIGGARKLPVSSPTITRAGGCPWSTCWNAAAGTSCR